jgi:hypothetical protein
VAIPLVINRTKNIDATGFEQVVEFTQPLPPARRWSPIARVDRSVLGKGFLDDLVGDIESLEDRLEAHSGN